jgi:hypothetical protein
MILSKYCTDLDFLPCFVDAKICLDQDFMYIDSYLKKRYHNSLLKCSNFERRKEIKIDKNINYVLDLQNKLYIIRVEIYSKMSRFVLDIRKTLNNDFEIIYTSLSFDHLLDDPYIKLLKRSSLLKELM